MTEAEWLEGTDSKLMLDFLGDKATNRKYRLFACACVRRSWQLLVDERSRNAVIVAEKFADSLVDKSALDAVAVEAKAAAEAQSNAQTAAKPRSSAVFNLNAAKAAHELKLATVNVHWAASWTAVGAGKVAAWAAAKNTERTGQPALLREMFGNPFVPRAVENWTPATVLLAKGVYSGEHGYAALQSLLGKAGHGDLAEHFAKVPAHPKGCWVLDLILGKQ